MEDALTTELPKKKKGKIRAYSKDVNAGVIDGADGNTYRFRVSDMPDGHEPINAENVTFDGNHKDAHNIEKDDEK